MSLNQYKNQLNLYNAINNNVTVSSNVVTEIQQLISTLEANISILEEYKKFPRKLTKLLNQKEVRIQQVMCNIDSIAELTG
jgi:exonuclease VII small subunit